MTMIVMDHQYGVVVSRSNHVTFDDLYWPRNAGREVSHFPVAHYSYARTDLSTTITFCLSTKVWRDVVYGSAMSRSTGGALKFLGTIPFDPIVITILQSTLILLDNQNCDFLHLST